jgi:uncharacterized membrane protein YhhN
MANSPAIGANSRKAAVMVHYRPADYAADEYNDAIHIPDFRPITLKRNSIFLIGVVAAATISMVLSNLLEMGTLSIVSKMTASSAFVALALAGGASQSLYGRIVLLALALSWIGDLLLAGQSEQLFLFGLVSFLLAHVAYIIAFSVRGIDRTCVLIALAPIALLSVIVSIWLASFVPTNMVIPVRVYTLVISLMVIAAFGTRGAGAPLLVPIGALLFYFSDLSVAAGQFVQTDFPNYVWGLPFYFGGQVLLALSASTATDPPESGR